MSVEVKNHLAKESSPYLKQHATNPVDWYPWGQEAFDRAKSENKLIFLSIGYSTCHWCHVMERESFSQESIGAFMNQRYVSIKVDREERPDVDSVFINFSQRTTGSAGWPLNIILTPNLLPVFAFTYIPPTSRYGSMGITELLGDIYNLWVDNPDQILRKSSENKNELAERNQIVGHGAYTSELIEQSLNQFSKTYDRSYGGFGNTMKFPSPHILSFILRESRNEAHRKMLDFVENTIGAIRMGGIYDQIGGGIHRYATDPGWKIPHFEKMLYDQAGLIGALSEAFISTGKTFYKDIIDEILGFLRSNFSSTEGGFYTAMDADSDGREGKYYLWKHGEIVSALKDNYEAFMKLFNVMEEGNFLDSVKGTSDGENILYLDNESSELQKFSDRGLFWLTPEIRDQLKILGQVRGRRNPPLTDTKICGDLNGFMLYNLSVAYYATGSKEIYHMAKDLNDFLLKNYVKDGKCLHIHYGEGNEVPGFFSDYSFISMGLFRYGMAVGDPLSIREAEELLDTLTLISRRELEKYNDTGESSFIGTLNSQEDSSMPSQFSAYERALMFQSLTADFQEPLPFSTDETLENIKKYPSFFTSRLDTELIRLNCYVIKGKFQDLNEVENIATNLRKVTKKELFFLNDENTGMNQYSLCNYNSCFIDSKPLQSIVDFLFENKSL